MYLERLKFTAHSTSLSDGNLVDGLLLARHTEAVGGPHRGGALASIDDVAPRKLKMKGNCDWTFLNVPLEF